MLLIRLLKLWIHVYDYIWKIPVLVFFFFNLFVPPSNLDDFEVGMFFFCKCFEYYGLIESLWDILIVPREYLVYI